MKSSSGFTLIEMLVATVIMGILITAVLAPLTSLFKNTATSGQRLRVTTQAQELTEYVRGQWQSYPEVLDSGGNDKNSLARAESRDRYDKTCSVPLPQQTGITKTVQVKALDVNADEVGTLTLNENCGGATPASTPPPMKRLTVTTTTVSGSSSNLTLDIPRP